MRARRGETVLVAGLAALLAVALPAASQRAVDGGVPGTADVTAADDVRTALAREIARLKAETAGIERLMRWQAGLTRTARTDRAEALRQRLPMSDCLGSALAPLCGDLGGLFRPEEGGGEGSVAAVGGAEDAAGEGEGPR